MPPPCPNKHPWRRRAGRWLLLALCLHGFAHAAGTIVYYPQPESSDDARTAYPLKLLQLALTKVAADYRLLPSKRQMQQGRALVELASGQDVNVVWSMTSQQREAELLPIRIPIYKGLIGWRIPLLAADQAQRFQHVRQLADFDSLVAGQGHDWPDTQILRANGINVLGVARYDSLFKMLARHRFDYFPRSVAEISAEAQAHADDGIVIDPYIVIHYPAAFYYFVNRRDTVLAETIRQGLEKAIADGSFDKMFYEHFAPLIDQLKLAERVIIQLDNPVLPEATPLQRKALWFHPKDARPR